MKLLAYLKYFFYLGLNWNFRIAALLIREEIKGEKEFGISTTGADELKQLGKEGTDIAHSTIYMPVSYSILDEIFSAIPNTVKTHFLDIGCGKGRAMCVAAHKGFSKISGIDFSQKFCEIAIKNLKATKGNKNDFAAEIIWGNAKDISIEIDTDCIFLFNPFDETIMEQVVQNILKSYHLYKRTIYITYVNPLHKSIFLQNGFAEIHYSKRMHYLELSILKIGS